LHTPVSATAKASSTDATKADEGQGAMITFALERGTNAWAKPDVHLVCGECVERMEAE